MPVLANTSRHWSVASTTVLRRSSNSGMIVMGGYAPPGVWKLQNDSAPAMVREDLFDFVSGSL
jgi:hypothetical protein